MKKLSFLEGTTRPLKAFSSEYDSVRILKNAKRGTFFLVLSSPEGEETIPSNEKAYEAAHKEGIKSLSISTVVGEEGKEFLLCHVRGTAEHIEEITLK